MSAARQRKKSGSQDSNALIARNRRAFHDYAFSDRYEAGIALQGTEIKSIRAGQASLREGYVRLVDGEAWLEGVHIPPYLEGSYYNHEPTRPRRLLLHKSELRQLKQQTDTRATRLSRCACTTSGAGSRWSWALVAGSASTRSGRRWRPAKPSARWIAPSGRTAGSAP